MRCAPLAAVRRTALTSVARTWQACDGYYICSKAQENGREERHHSGAEGRSYREAAQPEPRCCAHSTKPSRLLPCCLCSRYRGVQNMVGPGEVDAELQSETQDECTKFGPVRSVVVHEVRSC